MNTATNPALTIETLPCGTVRTSATSPVDRQRLRGLKSADGVISYEVSYDRAGLVWMAYPARNMGATFNRATRARIEAALA